MRDLVEAGPVAIGPVLAEARDAGIDQAPVERPQALIVDAEPELHVGTKILHQHVGRGDEPLQDLDAVLLLEVERHAPLVAVKILEIGEVAPAAELAIALSRLDLDDLGAPIGKLAHGGRARAHAGEIDDLEAG